MTKTTNNQTLTLPLLLSALLSAGAAPTLAASYPERIAAAERSASIGLGVERLALLKREVGPGAEKVADDLHKRLYALSPGIHTGERFQREVTERQTTLVSDEGWYLSVYGDGTGVRYRNYAYLDQTDKLDRPLKERFSEEELEKMGRAFIAESLDDLIQLGKNEELIPYFSEFEVSGGGSTEPGADQDEEMVHASTLVFSRTIDGQPVVGGGSKIAVIFANDGEPVGFDYDWPSYAPTGKVQTILPLEYIQRRAEEYGAFSFEDPEVEEQHFECGYVDFGARKRDPEAPLQGGCLRQAAKRTVVDEKIHAEDPNSGHLVSASLDYLPAGETVESDRVWEEALKPEGDAGETGPR